MFKSPWFLVFSAGALVACSKSPAEANPPAAGSVAPQALSKTEQAVAQAATAAADFWLTLVDAEKYADSWANTARFFQQSVTQANWENSLGTARRPLGKVVSRKLRSSDHKTSLPGVPDGNYVLAEYDTVFEKKAQASELVTTMQDADGTYRVAGYFVR